MLIKKSTYDKVVQELAQARLRIQELSQASDITALDPGTDSDMAIPEASPVQSTAQTGTPQESAHSPIAGDASQSPETGIESTSQQQDAAGEESAGEESTREESAPEVTPGDESPRVTQANGQTSPEGEETPEQVQALERQIQQLQQRLSVSQRTIERLMHEGAAPPASAVSSSDADGNPTIDLVEFCRVNADDTQACLDRLRQEGF